MRIALLHPDSPTAEGSGAVHSATLIGESLSSLGHDVVFYCPGPVDEYYTQVETRKLNIKPSRLKNKYSKINDRIFELEDELATFDIFHSYLMRTIPSVGQVSKDNDSLSTIISLNAYGALCPKNDLLYKNKHNCYSNGILRCSSCVHSSMRELPPKPERGHIYRGGRILHHIVKNMKNYPLVSDIDEYKEGINGFQALSDHVKNAYASFGFPENRIRVIPNILDEQFQIPHKSSFSEPIKLLYVGELKKHKGVDRLPHLLSELNKTADRDFELSIVGKGPLKHEIVEKGANMGLEEDMTVYGFMEYEKLPELYANHDIFVYLGRWQEPFGRVFLESLATGTPVVSTNVGAVSEIIGEGGEVGNGIDEVVAKIQSLSQSQLQEYSEYAKVRAKKFRQDDIVEEIERLYVEVN